MIDCIRAAINSRVTTSPNAVIAKRWRMLRRFIVYPRFLVIKRAFGRANVCS